MLFGFTVFFFILISILLITLILLQKSKNSFGLGAFGGQTQNLFGGSGGQELFQKITWVLGGLFMAGSLFLAILKKPTGSEYLNTISTQQAKTAAPIEVPQKPEEAQK